VRLTVTGRHRLDADTRAYAEEKLRRLERHANLHDVSLILDHDSRRVPEAMAEVVVHLHHQRLAAKVDGSSLREAIDRVVDKADEQIRRKRERVTEHKGQVGADAISPKPPHNGRAQHGGDGTISERRARLRPMTLQDALIEIDRRDLPYLLFLDDDTGEVNLLARRQSGGFELVVADTR
jgi:putative sigma-54 modulation protein